MCRKPIIGLGVVEKSRSLLRSAEKGAGQLLLNSLTPQGDEVAGSCALGVGPRGAGSARIQVPVDQLSS